MPKYHTSRNHKELLHLQLGIRHNSKLKIVSKLESKANVDEKIFTFKNSVSEFNVDTLKLTFMKNNEYIKDGTFNADIFMPLIHKINEQKNELAQLSIHDQKIGREYACKFNNIALPHICLNRCSIKLANINYLFDRLITNIKDNLTFADICSAPGGFTYLLKNVLSGKIKSYMLSMYEDQNDIEFSNKLQSTSNFLIFKTYGNVYDIKIWNEFKKKCNSVDFVLADGGFSVEGVENLQEQYSKLLYISQTILALKILKPNGFFLCKLFNIYTNFSVGLLYLLSFCFKSISIVKPHSSRAANSEKYIICENFTENLNILSHLEKIHQTMYNKNEMGFVNRIVDLKDSCFIEWITSALLEFHDIQTVSLTKYVKPINELLFNHISEANTHYSSKFIKKWMHAL